jgi:hypothetical protein
MTIETTYEHGQSIFIVVGSEEKAKIVEAIISSIDIKVIATGVITTYNCLVDRKATETEVGGMSQFYSVIRNEDNMFNTPEEVANHITKKTSWKQKN